MTLKSNKRKYLMHHQSPIYRHSSHRTAKSDASTARKRQVESPNQKLDTLSKKYTFVEDDLISPLLL